MVAIIGAGIIGLSCAWRLAQRGIAVTVFDRQKAATDASWAAAGMLAPESEMTGPAGLESARMWPGFVRELEAESGLEIDFRECAGGRLESVVDPRDVNRALLGALAKRGVIIRENHEVRRIDPSDEAVVVAAGARSSQLSPGAPETMPVKGYLLSWRLPPGVLEPILREGHTYVFQRRGGLVVAGSTTEYVGWDASVDHAMIAELRSRAEALLPALRGLQPVETWLGFRPGIAADGPCVGRIQGTRIWQAFGHFRNGVLLAPWTARVIAEELATFVPTLHTAG